MSTIAFTVCFAVWTIFSIIGIRIKQELGLNETQFGLLVGTPILTGSLVRLVLGIWTGRYGGRVVFTFTMLAAAAATFLLAHAATYAQLRSRFEKLGRLMDEAEHDVLAYMTFAAQHRTKLHSTNPLERLNKEVKRRADVVGIFPNEESIVRLVGAVLMEHNDDWQTQNRSTQIEGFAEPADKTPDLKPLQITPKAA